MSVLTVVDEDGVRWLRLARPEARNGIDEALRDELSAQLLAADLDPAARCVVLAEEGAAIAMLSPTHDRLEGVTALFEGR
jgi:enoyl-CoA hydratase/carnithine racemase